MESNSLPILGMPEESQLVDYLNDVMALLAGFKSTNEQRLVSYIYQDTSTYERNAVYSALQPGGMA